MLNFRNFHNTLRTETGNLTSAIEVQHAANPWFTPDFCEFAVQEVLRFLEDPALDSFIQNHSDSIPEIPKSIAVISENATPLECFYELFLILASGNSFQCKTNRKNSILLEKIFGIMSDYMPELRSAISFSDRLADFDAVIADFKAENADSFSRYFGGKPHVFRKNCSAVAVLDSNETAEELYGLGIDISAYFGRSGYSVRKMFVPENYNFVPLTEILSQNFPTLASHHHFLNNIDYQKTVNLMGKKKFIDAGTFLLVEDGSLFPPAGVVNYAFYSNKSELIQHFSAKSDEVSAVISRNGIFAGAKPPGTAHRHHISDLRDINGTLDIIYPQK